MILIALCYIALVLLLHHLETNQRRRQATREDNSVPEPKWERIVWQVNVVVGDTDVEATWVAVT